MGHRLAAPSEHMLLCKQAKWPGEGKFYELEAQTTTVSYAFYRNDNTQIAQGPDVGENRVVNQFRFLVHTRSHDSTYNYIKEYSQYAPCTTRQTASQYRFQMAKLVPNLPARERSPANISSSSRRSISTTRTCCCQRLQTGTGQVIAPRISFRHSSL